MSPKRIVQEAEKRGINVIAICDHNSAENTWAAIKAARNTGIFIIPGMEITSQEEVHILGWFPSVEAALEVQAKVYGALPGTNDPDKFGLQVVADEDDVVMDFNERLLIGATTLPLEEIVRVIKRAGGLAVASHIDREGFGILGQLGFIPPELELDALEVTSHLGIEKAKALYPNYSAKFPFVCSSDAHVPEDLGQGTTELECKAASFEEIRLAVKGLEGRKIC